MDPQPRALMVYCTCPTEAVAQSLAEAAVTERLAACVNRVPGVASVYRWEGRIETDQECLLIAKTLPACLERLSACWRGLHPYELPEIVAVPVIDGCNEYLAWIADQVDV